RISQRSSSLVVDHNSDGDQRCRKDGQAQGRNDIPPGRHSRRPSRAASAIARSLAKLVIPGTLSFFTWDCAETTETLMTAMARNSTALFIPTPLTYERISPLLSAIYGDNSRGHHAGIGAHEVRNQFVEYSVRVSAGRLGNSSGIPASGRCTYGQLHSLFKECIQCGAPVR